MNAPTPGPWTHADRFDGEARRVLRSDGSAVAIVCPHEQAEADARLIAAAPDLYEAMTGAMQYLDETLGPCDDDCECLLHSFHAAIAKAEGR